ncbi:hypothetical protein Hanom_Chr03g00240921 [Helianthus anomalus]
MVVLIRIRNAYTTLEGRNGGSTNLKTGSYKMLYTQLHQLYLSHDFSTIFQIYCWNRREKKTNPNPGFVSLVFAGFKN